MDTSVVNAVLLKVRPQVYEPTLLLMPHRGTSHNSFSKGKYFHLLL